MYKNGKRLAISELRTLYRKYKEKDPEKINNLRSQINFHNEAISNLFDQYIDSKNSLNRLIAGSGISSDISFKEIRNEIYGYLDFIIINFEKYHTDTDNNEKELRYINELRLDSMNQVDLLNEHGIIFIDDFFNAILDDSINNIIGMKEVLVLIGLLAKIIKYCIENSIYIPDEIFHRFIEYQAYLYENDISLVTLYHVSKFASAPLDVYGGGELIFKITYLSCNDLKLLDFYINCDEKSNNYAYLSIPDDFDKRHLGKVTELISHAIDQYYKWYRSLEIKTEGV